MSATRVCCCGVLDAIWLADRTGIAPKPAHLGEANIYGAALLCGNGFTKIVTLAGAIVAGLLQVRMTM